MATTVQSQTSSSPVQSVSFDALVTDQIRTMMMRDDFSLLVYVQALCKVALWQMGYDRVGILIPLFLSDQEMPGSRCALTLCDSLTPAQRFSALLSKTRSDLIRAYTYQHVPTSRLVCGAATSDRECRITCSMDACHHPDHITKMNQMHPTLHSVHIHCTGRIQITRPSSGSVFQQPDHSEFRARVQSLLVRSHAEGKWTIADLVAEKKPARHPDIRLSHASHCTAPAVSITPLTAPKIPVTTPVSTLFEAIAAKVPDHDAVVYNHHRYSYQQINESANQLAHLLQNCVLVNPEEQVAVCINRSPGHIQSVMAVLKAGASYLALESSLPKDRMKHMLADADVKTLIVDTLTLMTVLDLLSENTSLRNVVVINESDDDTPFDSSANIQFYGQESILNQPVTNLDGVHFKKNGKQLAYTLYTSGSTGTPKGVMIDHAALISFVYSIKSVFNEDIGPGERILQNVNQSFDVNIFEIFAPLLFGATSVIAEKMPYVDIEQITELMQDNQVTIAYLPASLLQDAIECFDKHPAQLSLKYLLVGAEVITCKLLSRFQQLSPNLTIVNAYGPTEATVCSSYFVWPVSGFDTTYGLTEPKYVPIGKQLPNTDLVIFNDQMKAVAPNEEGEIYIGGWGLMRGYMNNPSLTAKHVITDPRDSSRRLYKSGDYGRCDESGIMHFSGRRDTQIKLQGFRIELGDIEGQIVEFSSVKQAIVQLIDESQPFLETYITLTCPVADERKFIIRLSRHLASKLPDYMLPAYVHIVPDIPMTLSGKVDYCALASRASDSR